MTSKTKMISALLLMSIAPLSFASYGQFDLSIPGWFAVLIYSVILLLATPLLWSLWLLGKRGFGSVLSPRDHSLLRLGAGFHYAYAVCYCVVSNAFIPWWQLYPQYLPVVVGPFLLLMGLGYACARFGRS